MKIIYCLSLLLFYGLICLGQDKSSITNNNIYGNTRDTLGIVSQPDQPSDYPGGNKAWSLFLMKNLNIEQSLLEMQRKKVQQQTAVVQFVVCTDGAICEVKVINEVLPSVKKEAERVIKRSGK